ncbi:MAG: UTP--glucose-1-phosphate uridylyltransferase [Solimonas sp.]
MQRDQSGSGNDRAVVLFLLALGVLLPPGLWVWIGQDRPWWWLYAAWFAVIAATAVLQGRRPR